MATTQEYESYWNAVLGEKRSPARVIAEFDLDPADRRGLDEWLGRSEEEAIRAGNLDREATLAAWGDGGYHSCHERALRELEAAVDRRTSILG